MSNIRSLETMKFIKRKSSQSVLGGRLFCMRCFIYIYFKLSCFSMSHRLSKPNLSILKKILIVNRLNITNMKIYKRATCKIQHQQMKLPYMQPQNIILLKMFKEVLH